MTAILTPRHDRDQTEIIRSLQTGYLINSPYLSLSHQLRLSTIDTQSYLLALALTHLQPVTPRYSTTDYILALNWAEVFDHLSDLAQTTHHRWTTQTFYIVEFRSRLRSKIDRDLLFQLDEESHREATESGGLLKYWFGVPDANRRNLATCLWTNKEAAAAGGKGPWHRRARSATGEMYEEINVKGLRLTIDGDVRSWGIKPEH